MTPTAKARKLPAAARQAIVNGSPPKGKAVSPTEKQPDTKTYSGRLALRIRTLRKSKGMSVKELAESVTEAGYKLGTMTLYHWENGGRDTHLDAVPFIAKVLRVKLHDLLPPK